MGHNKTQDSTLNHPTRRMVPHSIITNSHSDTK